MGGGEHLFSLKTLFMFKSALEPGQSMQRKPLLRDLQTILQIKIAVSFLFKSISISSGQWKGSNEWLFCYGKNLASKI